MSTLNEGRLFTIKEEARANKEVFEATGECVHPLKELIIKSKEHYKCKLCKEILPGPNFKEFHNKEFRDQEVPIGQKGNYHAHAVYFKPLKMNRAQNLALREMFNDACVMIGVDGGYFVDRCMDEIIKVYHRTTFIPMPNGKFGDREWTFFVNQNHFAAYVFYRVLFQENVYRTMEDIAKIFGTTEASINTAEDRYCKFFNKKKLYMPAAKLVPTIIKWMDLPYKIGLAVEKITASAEKRFFGRTPELIIVAVFDILKTRLADEYACQIDLHRLTHVMGYKELPDTSQFVFPLKEIDLLIEGANLKIKSSDC